MADVTEAVNAQKAVDNKKKIIKYVIIALVAVGAFFLIKKYILK